MRKIIGVSALYFAGGGLCCAAVTRGGAAALYPLGCALLLAGLLHLREGAEAAACAAPARARRQK